MLLELCTVLGCTPTEAYQRLTNTDEVILISAIIEKNKRQEEAIKAMQGGRSGR